jgi:subtilisin family serine protease
MVPKDREDVMNELMRLVKRLCAMALSLMIIGASFPPGDDGLLSSGFVTSALADDDDGDDDGGDDDGDDDDDGASISRRSTTRAAPRRQRLQAFPQYARAELISHGLDNEDIGRLTAADYIVLEQSVLSSSGQIVHRLRIPRRLTFAEARAEVLASSPDITIDLNHYYQPNAAGDCIATQCLARNLIGWSPMEEDGRSCSGGIRIGMIDTAINAEHAALMGSRIEVKRLAAEKLPPSGMQHGTAVAALLVGNLSGRSPGLLPEAELIAVDTFHRLGRHGDVSDAYSIVKALDYLESRKIEIVNLSLTGPANALLEKAVKRLTDKGVMLIAAAGNDGPKAKPVYPAAYPDVVAVTAVDRQKRPYRRAARGAHIDLAAPGVDVWIAASVEGARPRTGTSFAAPFVTAAMALARKSEPLSGKAAALSRLTKAAEDLGEPGHDETFGWGLLNPAGLCG